MLDPNAVTKLVEQEIAKSVNSQVLQVFATDDWLKPIEEKIVKYTQDRILGKFASASAVPELIDTVKASVRELFDQGQVPGIEQFVDSTAIQQSVDLAVEQTINAAIVELGKDSAWLSKIETMINQAVVQRTVASLNSIDVKSVIRNRVDETLEIISDKIKEKLDTHGIQDTASACELTVMDQQVVIENTLTAKKIEAVESAVIKDLAVTGSINVDNHSWQTLSKDIAQKTLEQLTAEWKDSLVNEVANSIKKDGIQFDNVYLDDKPLVSGNTLAPKITQSNIQSLGTLSNLQVKGEAHIYDTMSVVNKRVGVNTAEPEMALSVWDEEVNLLVGKHKNKNAYIGTGRLQSLSIGVNRDPAIEIDTDGLTAIKKLRVGLHKISHANEVPGWAGTKGDIVFNANPTIDNPVFAWVCLGNYKWKTIRAVE